MKEKKQAIKDFDRLIGARLRYLRTIRNYKQEIFSDMLEIDRTTYGYYESGKILVCCYYLRVICDFYGIPIHVLTTFDEKLFNSFITEYKNQHQQL